MMSIESWGLPTQTRADLEMELAILHGIKGDITCIGVPEYKKMHYVASFQHYKNPSRLFFIRDKKQLENKPVDGVNHVDDLDESTTLFYHVESPMSTGVKKKKDSAVEIYDPKQVSQISSENYDTLIQRLAPGKQRYVFLCPYIPNDQCTHSISFIRMPFDAQAVITNDRSIQIADSFDAKIIKFRDYAWQTPIGYRSVVVKSINASLGIFFGAKNFACYGRANLVRPPKGKLKKMVAFESYDIDGNVQVDYWDQDEPHTQKGAPTTTTTNTLLTAQPGPVLPQPVPELQRATVVNEEM